MSKERFVETPTASINGSVQMMPTMTFDVEELEYTYTYNCKRCGHEWSETHDLEEQQEQ